MEAPQPDSAGLRGCAVLRYVPGRAAAPHAERACDVLLLPGHPDQDHAACATGAGDAGAVSEVRQLLHLGGLICRFADVSGTFWRFSDVTLFQQKCFSGFSVYFQYIRSRHGGEFEVRPLPFAAGTAGDAGALLGPDQAHVSA